MRHWILLAAIFAAACSRKQTSRALNTDEALQSFRLSEDFRIELFAAEPMVVDPVEMAFDENGRAWVADMIDYPEDPPKGKPARSRIVVLEDRDGDGRADWSAVFAEHVLQVSGLLPWKGGLIVTSAPDILYMKDTNGDGRADVRKVLYTGFPKVNPEGRITNPRFAIDNWVYCANDGANGSITAAEHPERPPVLARGADLRFHPVRGFAEPASGAAQYGLTMDDFGNRFITQNTTHIRHVVVPMQYLLRAPLVEVPAVAQDISDHGRPSAPMFPLTGPQEWRIRRTRLRQQRYDEDTPKVSEHVAGYFTGASGGTVYTGDAFGPDYAGNVFTADVSANLVHLDVLKPDGVSYTAARSKDNVEFLASTDQWFRPCNFSNAPDGNLYLMDIYREFIETPDSIPEAIKKGMDFWSGDTVGRIYRIVPNRPRVKRNLRPGLGQAASEELVRYLEHANGWHREAAQRLLIERQDKSVAPALKQLAVAGARPEARARALWTLEGLDELEPRLVTAALQDRDARVREHALRLSELWLPASAPLTSAVLRREGDPNARVRYQLAFTLSRIRNWRAVQVLAAIANERAADPWFRIAVLASAHDRVGEVMSALARGAAIRHPDFAGQFGALLGAKREPDVIARFISAIRNTVKPEAGLSGLARGLRLSGGGTLPAPPVEAALAPFFKSRREPVLQAAWEVARFFELRTLLRKAASDALNSSLSPKRRALALRALSGAPYNSAAPVLKRVVASHPPPQLQVAAIDALATFDDPAVAQTVISGWKSFSPEGRQRGIAALLGKRDRVPALLEAIELGEIETSALEVGARARLIEDTDNAVAARARKLFATSPDERNRVIERYRPALSLKGDIDRGKKLFDENCARCHTPRRQGDRIGPDLSGVNNKTKEELLTSILNSSYAIEPRYVNYIVTTKAGRVYDGVLANETPGSITLRGGAEEDITILRAQISDIRASRISLMPEDLEKSLDPQGVADVIAYLRGGI